MVTGSFPGPGRNIGPEKEAGSVLFPRVLFNYFFLAKRCPSPEPGSPQAIKGPAKIKAEEIEKEDRSSDSAVSLVGLRRGSEGACGQPVEDMDLQGRGAPGLKQAGDGKEMGMTVTYSGVSTKNNLGNFLEEVVFLHQTGPESSMDVLKPTLSSSPQPCGSHLPSHLPLKGALPQEELS